MTSANNGVYLHGQKIKVLEDVEGNLVLLDLVSTDERVNENGEKILVVIVKKKSG